MEAEQSVLGALMLVPAALAQVSDLLTADDFYRRDHQHIFRAIEELDCKGKPFDAVTLGEWFESRGMSEQVANGAYLIELASTTPSAANVRAYADIVRDKAILRKLVELGTSIANDGLQPDGRDSASIVDTAIADLMRMQRSTQECEFTMKQAVALAWDDASEAYTARGTIRGVPTGYNRMDKRLGGWHKGDLILIGARPSMGKTALMVNLALNAASEGHAIGIISGEQSAMQIGQRSIAAHAQVGAEQLRHGNIDEESWSKLGASVSRLRDGKVRIYDRSAPTLDELCRVARRWKQEFGIDVLFVDYLQRIRAPKAGNRIDEVAEVSRGLKTLARDLDIPVIALAQVKAEVDKRPGDKRPSLGDVANSDEATREADLIGFLYRDAVYNDETDDREVAELNFEKNRHGPTGRFKLRFDGATMKFSDLTGASDHGPHM
ncbi:replicative DNA helicase [Lysobacter zhanggongensis]|uniref:replicative DNA helicase n=1 Tax=Lysobacter zhanggongensis TaxID=1774951 RepID=UPI00399CB4A3